MTHRHNRLSMLFACLVLAGTTSLFQGCSFFSPSKTSEPTVMAGGGTVDGMKFLTYGTCSGSALNIVNELALSSDGMSANLLRQNCQTLNSPVTVSTNDLQFALGNTTVMKFAGQVYDQQSTTGSQQTTLQFCQSTGGPQVQAIIWQDIGNTNSLFGSVTPIGSNGTGTMTVTQSNGTSYSASTGQTSSFSLNVPASSPASLTYALTGGTPVTVSMTCSTQAIPNLADGSEDAPAGTPSSPTLLSGYSIRPPWNVAGVDYSVGVPEGTSLKDPFPGGALDPALVALGGSNSGNIITFQGVNNIVIDSYDFSLEGGWGLVIGGNGATIQNCNFEMTSNSYFYITTTGTPVGLTIRDNTMDGGSTTFEILQLAADGTTTIEYNLIKNAPLQFIQATPAASGNSVQIVQNNLFENGSETSASSWIQDYSQTTGTWKDIEIGFNTFIQSTPNTGTQGISVLSAGDNQASTLAEDISNNTIIVSGTGAVTYGIIADTTWLNGSATVNDNYFDPTGMIYSPYFIGQFNTQAGPYSGTASESGNVNMVSGGDLP